MCVKCGALLMHLLETSQKNYLHEYLFGRLDLTHWLHNATPSHTYLGTSL